MELGQRPVSRYVWATFAAVSVCVLAVGLSCPSQRVQTPMVTAADNHDDIVLFFTGNTLGALKPCGCSGGQLGGLEKRMSIFAAAPKANRLLVDTGALVQSDREQDLIKFRLLFEALRLIGYDLVHLGPQDVEIAANLGILSEGDKPFGVMAASRQNTDLPQTFAKQFKVGDRTISVNVAAFNAQSGPVDQAAGLFPGGDAAQTLNILILVGSEGRAAADILRSDDDSIISSK